MDAQFDHMEARFDDLQRQFSELGWRMTGIVILQFVALLVAVAFR